jgi:hypothetical protein
MELEVRSSGSGPKEMAWREAPTARSSCTSRAPRRAGQRGGRAWRKPRQVPSDSGAERGARGAGLPPCRHLRRLRPSAYGYLTWKREQVIGALGSRGLEAPVEEVRPVPRSAGGARPSLLSALDKACPSATALRVRMRSSTSLRVQPPHLRPPAKDQGCTGAAAWRETRSARHRHGDRPGPRRGCRGCERGPASSEQTWRGERDAWCGKVPSPLSADSPAPVRMTMLRNLVIRRRAKVTRVFPSP